MRLKIKAVVAAMLALTCGSALAQDDAAPDAAPSAPPAQVNPRGPVPYTTLQRPTRPAVARPAAAASASASAATTTTPSAPIGVVAPLPVTASGARLAASEALPPAELEAFVDGVVRGAMARDHIAGVTVSVVQGGQVVLKKGYGFADLAPQRRVDPDRTLFRVGSISKTFTWIALMKEIEAGRIRKDAPVNLYLPERLQIRDQGYRTPVRIINLMDHSPGFEDRALGQLFERNFDRERPLADYLRQERPKRVRGPGEVSSYSNYGAALAGQAVSYVAGKPFERLIEESIFIPAGMRDTSFREPHPPRDGIPGAIPARLAEQISEGYRWTPGGFQRRDFEYIGHIAPAGSASSTAADMARYMQLLLNQGSIDGTVIYGPVAAQAFRTPIRKTAPGINGWRHGFIAYGLPGDRTGFGHAGGTLSFLSNMVVIPELNLGVFISTNTDTGGDLAMGLASQVVQQFYTPPAPFPRAGSPALKDQAQTFQGYYLSGRRAYHGLESIIGLLTGGVTVSVDRDGRLVTSGFNGARTWVPEGDVADGRFIATNGADRLVFDVSQGRAVGYQTGLGDMTYERTGFWMKPNTAIILGALTFIAACATLGGVLLRNRREFRETSDQSRASVIQNTQAGLWITMIVLFAIWASGAGDIANVMYRWPGPLLLIASACAMVAAALTLATLLLLPVIWRGGRRVDSWTALRKLAFSITTLIYAAFTIVLWFWGVLTPWAG